MIDGTAALTAVINVLVIEDNEDDFVLLEAFLDSAEFQLTWSHSAGNARQQLAKASFDLILLDHGLPDTNALTFVQELTRQENAAPVIVLTGMEDEMLAISAIKQGAANYILKDEIAGHLLPAINEAVHQSVNVHQRAYYQNNSRFVDKADNIYETLLDTMTEGCIVISPLGEITFVNIATGQLTLQHTEKLLGRNILELFERRSRQRLEKVLTSQQGSHAPEKAVMEGELQLENGATLPVRIAARRLQDSSTTLIVLTDISAQIEARANLSSLYRQASEGHSRLQAVIESSWDGLMFVTNAGEILTINSKTVTLLNLPKRHSQWIGSHITTMFATLGAVWQPLRDEIQQMLHCVPTGVAHEGESCFDGKVVQWQMSSVLDGATPIGLLVALRDNTDMRSAENMRDDLTRALVHDLRNPLTTILSSLELIQRFGEAGRNHLSDKQTHYVKGAIISTLRVSNLVSSILDMAKLESGEMPIDKQMLSITDLIYEVVAGQASVADAKQLQIAVEVPAINPSIYADYSLLQRVLQNLVDNAVKFTPAGGQLSISAEITRHTATLRVRDNGHGVPPEVRNRLFKRFASGNQKGRGSGLGLAFCKLVVEAHGGRIWVDSIAGQGATFSFTLPCS